MSQYHAAIGVILELGSAPAEAPRLRPGMRGTGAHAPVAGEARAANDKVYDIRAVTYNTLRRLEAERATATGSVTPVVHRLLVSFVLWRMLHTRSTAAGKACLDKYAPATAIARLTDDELSGAVTGVYARLLSETSDMLVRYLMLPANVPPEVVAKLGAAIATMPEFIDDANSRADVVSWVTSTLYYVLMEEITARAQLLHTPSVAFKWRAVSVQPDDGADTSVRARMARQVNGVMMQMARRVAMRGIEGPITLEASELQQGDVQEYVEAHGFPRGIAYAATALHAHQKLDGSSLSRNAVYTATLALLGDWIGTTRKWPTVIDKRTKLEWFAVDDDESRAALRSDTAYEALLAALPILVAAVSVAQLCPRMPRPLAASPASDTLQQRVVDVARGRVDNEADLDAVARDVNAQLREWFGEQDYAAWDSVRVQLAEQLSRDKYDTLVYATTRIPTRDTMYAPIAQAWATAFGSPTVTALDALWTMPAVSRFAAMRILNEGENVPTTLATLLATSVAEMKQEERAAAAADE